MTRMVRVGPARNAPVAWRAGLLLSLLLSLTVTADELAKLRQKLSRETDPADRAKITVKLGEELLEQAGRLYRNGAFTDGDLLLGDYLKAIRTAYDDLQESGRDARRKPKGFKDLEIHLRKSQRNLDDLMPYLPYENRGIVEETKQQAEEIRLQLLGLLLKVDLSRGEAQKEEKP